MDYNNVLLDDKVGDVLKRQAASQEMLERGSYRLEYCPDMTNPVMDSIVQS